MEYECDPRHAELLTREFNFNEKTRSVVAPGIDSPYNVHAPEVLSQEFVTPFRSRTMRANYMASDRPEMLYAAKFLAKHSSKLQVEQPALSEDDFNKMIDRTNDSACGLDDAPYA